MDMSQILQNALTTGMSTQMHAQAEIILKELSAVLAESEKILYTPIPISFTTSYKSHSHHVAFHIAFLSLAATRMVYDSCSILYKLGDAWRG
jgi:predicted membrane chloride channel (bestrophin family)